MNIQKIKFIVLREYLTRVRKKTFLLSTILTPLAIIGIMILSGYLGSGALSKSKKVLVQDPQGLVEKYMGSSTTTDFRFTNEQDIASLQERFIEDGYDFLIAVPQIEKDSLVNELELPLYSASSPGVATLESLERKISRAFKEYNIVQVGLTQSELDRLESKVDLKVDKMKEGKESEEITDTSIALGTGLGFAMGFLMYMILFIYGSFVMRSVMEEKINRIVEVVISSVKPFELMLGKIIGVGLVGLTQVTVWFVLIGIGATVVSAIFGVGEMSQDQMAVAMEEMQSEVDGLDMSSLLADVFALNWPLILISFVLFFFGGYFMYSSLFAAVGSAIGDDMAEGQSLTIPIAIPIIAAMVLLFPVLNDPQGGLAIFASLFPLTSPIIMPARLAFDPPIWQVILSILLMIGACIGLVWVSGKIYRGSILLYGKKLSFKNIWQLIRR